MRLGKQKKRSKQKDIFYQSDLNFSLPSKTIDLLIFKHSKMQLKVSIFKTGISVHFVISGSTGVQGRLNHMVKQVAVQRKMWIYLILITLFVFSLRVLSFF